MDENKELTALDNEELERLQRIEKLDGNQARKKIIFSCVTVFLIALFAFGTVFGGKYILSYEGQQPPETAQAAPVNEEGAKAAAVLSALITATEKDVSVKTDISHRFYIPEEDVSVSAPEGVDGEGLLKFVRSDIEDKLTDLYADKNVSGVFGEPNGDNGLFFASLTGEAENAVLADNPDNPGEIVAQFSYPAGDGAATDDASIKAVTEIFADSVRIKAYDIRPVKTEVKAYIGKNAGLDDAEDPAFLNRTEYSEYMSVRLDCEFCGGLEAYGRQEITLTAVKQTVFSCTKADFDIINSVYFIEKGDSDEINRRVVSDEDADKITIAWESSDPEILSVDNKGFYKGHKISDKPVTVTGTYVFNGQTYTDTVEFYVRKPVESVKLSEKTLTLKEGETAVLEPVIKPGNATLTDVYWFSADENVVTVNENGEVTAVGEGQAGVYVITFDGNYKKTCNITVSKEGK